MKNQVLTSGCVDYQFEIYVSENVNVIVWINEGICMATLLQNGHIYSKLKPVSVQDSSRIENVVHECAMSLIENYFYEDASIQVFDQLRKMK